MINGLLIAKCNFDFGLSLSRYDERFCPAALVTTDGFTVAIQERYRQLDRQRKDCRYLRCDLDHGPSAALMVWIQKKTKFGYDVFALGGSQASLCESSINVVKTSIIVYALRAVCGAGRRC